MLKRWSLGIFHSLGRTVILGQEQVKPEINDIYAAKEPVVMWNLSNNRIFKCFFPLKLPLV